MVHQVKVLAAKLNDLSSILGAHMGEGKIDSYKLKAVS